MILRCYKPYVESDDYFAKAGENLEMALLAYRRRKYNVCASRAYYAVFLGSIATLLELTDFRAPGSKWNHGQVQAELNRRLIMRRKVLQPSLVEHRWTSWSCDTWPTINWNQFLRWKQNGHVLEPRDLFQQLRRS